MMLVMFVMFRLCHAFDGVGNGVGAVDHSIAGYHDASICDGSRKEM